MTGDRESVADEAVGFTADLIRIESVNTGDPGTIGDGETRCCEYLRERLEEVGYECTLIESVPGRGNLVTRLEGDSRDALVIHAHVDVVPVNAEDWSVPPFSGEIRDGYLYGRGAVDMKNMAGMMLAVARFLRATGLRPRRDLIFAFFSDEESQGLWGAKWLVEHHPELFAGATEALSEVGGFSIGVDGGRRLYPLAVAEKGVAWAELTAAGTAGHASLPTPDNAVARVAAAIARIAEREFPVVVTEATAALLGGISAATGREWTAENLDAGATDLGPLGGIARAGLRHTATPTVLEAGYKVNVIPGSARAEVDCRVLPEGADGFRREIEDLAGPGVDVTWKWESPIAAPAAGPFVDAIAEVLGEWDPEGVVVPYLLHASTDNKHLARLGIAGYGFVPLRVPHDFDTFGMFHAVDERVPVESLRFGARVLLDLLLRA